jgi:recombination protein RecR
VSSELFDRLVTQLSRLPGIGRKTALRLGFSLVDDREMSGDLAQALSDVHSRVGECRRCRNLTEHSLCDVCSDASRKPVICVVESPADLRSIDEAGLFGGYYFVLHGLLAPLDGMGPRELGIDRLREMIREVGAGEVILALDATADGEATCSYLSKTLENLGVDVTRLARGLPSGASVEFADANTLTQAFKGRQKA